MPEVDEKSQRFFQMLALGASSPHCGAAYAECVRVVLLRAQEAGMYDPQRILP